MSTRHRLVRYEEAGTPLTGRFYPAGGNPKGAVLVFPTIAGPNPPIFRRAEMLNRLGYHAFVADYYGCPAESFGSFDDMRAAARPFLEDADLFRARLYAALEAFKAEGEVRRMPMAMIGYCMGGSAVCEMARSGAKLACGVSFHGTLSTQKPADPGAVKTPLLICHGHDDPLVPPDHVRAFEAEMDAGGAPWMLHIYSGTVHGFTDPKSDERDSDAVAYNAQADRMSWDAMKSFFAVHME